MVTYNPTLVNNSLYREVLTVSGGANIYYSQPIVTNFTSVDNFFNAVLSSGVVLFSTYPPSCPTLLNSLLGAVGDLDLSTSGVLQKTSFPIETVTRIGPVTVGGSKRSRRR